MKKLTFMILLSIALLKAYGQETVYNFKYFTVGVNEKDHLAEWAFYRLTREMVESEKKVDRISYYKQGGSAHPNDYSRSGYDRGHLVPYGHFNFDQEGGKETFSMINVIAQAPKINRGIVNYFEQYERMLAVSEGCILVTLGVEYGEKRKGSGKIKAIPKYFTRKVSTCEGEVITEVRIKNIFN